jgi:hypothetical protein
MWERRPVPGIPPYNPAKDVCWFVDSILLKEEGLAGGDRMDWSDCGLWRSSLALELLPIGV